MKFISKNRGFVTLGIMGLGAAVSTVAMLGAVTGIAIFFGALLGGAISLGISDIRANKSDEIDMRHN